MTNDSNDENETATPMTRLQFVERLTMWLMPRDPELAAEARERMTLDGVYAGKSRRIHRLVRLAYARGCRRGAACAWDARQPVMTREAGAS